MSTSIYPLQKQTIKFAKEFAKNAMKVKSCVILAVVVVLCCLLTVCDFVDGHDNLKNTCFSLTCNGIALMSVRIALTGVIDGWLNSLLWSVQLESVGDYSCCSLLIYLMQSWFSLWFGGQEWREERQLWAYRVYSEIFGCWWVHSTFEHYYYHGRFFNLLKIEGPNGL